MKRPAAACESVPEDNGSTVAKRPAAKQPKGAAKAKVQVQAKKKAKAKAKVKAKVTESTEQDDGEQVGAGTESMDKQQETDSERPDGQVEPGKETQVEKPTTEEAEPKKKVTKTLKRPAAANTGPSKFVMRTLTVAVLISVARSSSSHVPFQRLRIKILCFTQL